MSGGSKKQTVGYEYSSGDRLLLGHDVFDKITKIRWAKKTAWEGEAAFDPNNPGAPVRITIDKPDLFGGKKREGGVRGAIDVLFGHSTQGIHDYLAAKINSVFLPAYRGVTSLVMRHFYIGNNPYIKDLGITAQRIHRVRDGELQWYDEKSAIVGVLKANMSIYISLDTSASMNIVTSNGNTRLENAKIAINGLLDFISTNLGSTESIDICVVGWDGDHVSLIKRGVDTSAIEELKTFVSGLATIISQTVYEEGVVDAASFFSGTSATSRYVLFLTDGEPFFDGSVGEKETLADAAKSTLFSTGSLQSYAFNIDVADTTYTAYLDNTLTDSVPVLSGADPEALLNRLKGSITENADMNPTHMIREWLTHPVWGRGLPGSMIGDTYTTVADTLFAEGFGLSIYWSQEITHKDAINEIQRHIDAVRYTDPTTGKLELKLIRDDYEPETLPVLDNSNSTVVKFDRSGRTELYNQITVKYKNRATGDWASVTVRDDRAIRRLGRARNKTFEYPGIWRVDVALMVARRDLAANSREFARATVKTNRRIADLKPGDPFKLTDPKNGISGMICRVGQRTNTASLNGEITLEVAEDIFSEGWSIYAAPTGSRWTDPIGEPQDFSHATAFEKPYIITVAEISDSYIDQIPQDACYYAFAGTRPATGAHVNYNLYVYPDGTTQDPDFEFAISSEFTPSAVVNGDVGLLETVIPVSGFDDVDSLRVGHLVLIGDEADDQREIASIDEEVSEGDLTVTLKRGVADTIPRPITDGTILYFIGDQYAGDETEFIAGEIAEGYGTPVNGQGYFLGPYSYRDVEMTGRFFKPYPAANLLLDGQSFPENYSPPTSSVILSWRHRDRVLQSDQIIDFYEASDYGPELGTTYLVEADAIDSNGQLFEQAWFSQNVGLVSSYDFDLVANPPPVGTAEITLRVWSVREAETSLQAPEVSFKTVKAPTAVTALYKPLTAPSGVEITNSF